MFDSLKIYNLLKQKFPIEEAETLTSAISEALVDFSQNTISQKISELAEAQARTEQRLNELTETVKLLSQAQVRTEKRVEELAEAQARTEQRLNELAEAQARTEQRLNELAEAQARTEQRLIELAEAQRKTEDKLDELSKEFRREVSEIRKELGGLSMAVGYGIEDKVMPYFFDLAQVDYGIQLEQVDRKHYIYPDGRYDEINIFAEGTKDGNKCFLVGECKAQPSKKDIERFVKLIERLHKALLAPIYPIFIGYVFAPEVEHYAQIEYPDLRLMKTYEFELNYNIIKKKNSIKK